MTPEQVSELVGLVQEWQAADLRKRDPGEVHAEAALAERKARCALRAWTPAQAEPAAPQHEALRVAVMVAVSNPDLTWEQARRQLTDALNADFATP